MYNEPRRYRLTNVINVINILSSAVFIAGALELSEWILFSVRDEPVNRRFNMYNSPLVYYINVARSIFNIHPVARKA